MTDKEEKSLSVVVGDGDRVVARDIQLTLERNGFNVVGTPSTAEEIVETVRTEAPDLAVLSIGLRGETDGIELANKLRVEHSVPVIFLTGQSEDYVFEKARKSRPAGYVRKPFSGAELVASVEAAYNRLDPDKQLADRIPGIRSVAEPLEEGVIVSGIDGRVVLMNPSAEILTGWQEEEASGSMYSAVAPTTHLVKDGLGTNGGCHCLVTDRGGRQHTVKAITTSVRSDDRELLGTITILIDGVEDKALVDGLENGSIPGRARALEAFEKIVNQDGESDELSEDAEEPEEKPAAGHEALLDQIDDPLLVLDRDLNVVQANSKSLHTFDDDGPFMGRSFWDLFTDNEYQRYEKEILIPLREGRRHQFDFHDSRRSVWYNVNLYRSYEGVIALFHDVTEERITQAEEVRQHRLEGLGLLARGFAHDFNNHLTTVTGNLGLAKELEEDPALLEMLDEAEVASARAAGLVQQLMTFATGGKPVREPVKITDLVRQVLAEHRMGRPSIRYKFQTLENELMVNIDRAQVRRVLENLINNAEEAMPGGGTLSVNCKRISTDEVKAFGKEITVPSEEYFIIEVVDTGCGMDFETKEKAFEPYFSSRQEDNATGIGLTVCESIADAHDGFIHLDSNPDNGTKATFCLPIGCNVSRVEWEDVSEATNQSKSVSNDASNSDLELDRSKFKILILEDDGPIRRLIGATLRRHGYQITETAEGGETLSAYRKEQESGNRFDVVITDLTIENGMGGLETMRRLREMDDRVVAIVSSGYSDAAAMSNPSAFGFVEVIPKPYSPNHLKDTVDQVILKHCDTQS